MTEAELFQYIYGRKDDYKRMNYKPYGYIILKCPAHPYAYKGRIAEHRFVMERYLGRFLTSEEVVHHMDRDRQNNDISNLVLCKSVDEHMKKYHSKKYDPFLISQIQKFAHNTSVSRKDIAARFGVNPGLVKQIVLENKINWTPRDEHDIPEYYVKEALKTKSAEELAKTLGVHVSTLYRRFPQFFDKNRNCTYFLEQHKDKILEMKNAGLSNAKIAAQFGTNKNTIWANLQRWTGKRQRRTDIKAPCFLDEYRQEIETLLLDKVPQEQIARKLETNRTTLRVAIRRWSKQGVLNPEVAALLNANPHLKQKYEPLV